MDILLSIYHSVLLFLNCFWLLHCYLCDWFSPLQTHHVVPISGLCTWANRKSEMMLLMHNNNKNRRCYFLIQIDRYLSLHSITFLPFLLWNDLMSLLKKETDRESMADAESTPLISRTYTFSELKYKCGTYNAIVRLIFQNPRFATLGA